MNTARIDKELAQQQARVRRGRSHRTRIRQKKTASASIAKGHAALGDRRQVKTFAHGFISQWCETAQPGDTITHQEILGIVKENSKGCHYIGSLVNEVLTSYLDGNNDVPFRRSKKGVYIRTFIPGTDCLHRILEAIACHYAPGELFTLGAVARAMESKQRTASLDLLPPNGSKLNSLKPFEKAKKFCPPLIESVLGKYRLSAFGCWVAYGYLDLPALLAYFVQLNKIHEGQSTKH